MAALLRFAPRHGAVSSAAAIARLRNVVQATLDRQAQSRPRLVCQWQQNADGRLSCHWEIEIPVLSVPPH